LDLLWEYGFIPCNKILEIDGLVDFLEKKKEWGFYWAGNGSLSAVWSVRRARSRCGFILGVWCLVALAINSIITRYETIQIQAKVSHSMHEQQSIGSYFTLKNKICTALYLIISASSTHPGHPKEPYAASALHALAP
jgi:hypothetical protein